jgi:OOP family OmpA-OmpF porin
MNFETWTNTIGLLAHTGFGLSFLERPYLKRQMGNFMAGVTGQLNYLTESFNRRFLTILTQNKMLRLTEVLLVQVWWSSF